MNFSSSDNFGFEPVIVTKGRLFRGKGFRICNECKSYDGYYWRQAPLPGGGCYWTQTAETYKAKIWVPELGKYQYANVKFVEKDSTVSDAAVQTEFAIYCEKIILDTVKFCTETLKKNNKFSRDEMLKFARNCLRKNHPEIDQETKDKVLNTF